MSRAALVVACGLALAFAAVLLTASEPALALHCPQSPETEVAGCFYPEVTISADPTSVVVGSGTSTISYTVLGADPSQGCSKSGGWSGSIAVDSAGNAGAQETVGPFGSTGTINFNVICPADPTEGWAGAAVTVTSGGGPPPPPPPPPPPGGCTENGSSQLYSEYIGTTTVPQNVIVGQTFTVSITFRNAGTCTWTADHGYKLGSQNPQDNTYWGTNRVLLGAGEAIAPGQTKTFTLNATAPPTPGDYGFQWRMLREGINWFGPATPNVVITVTECCYPSGWYYEGNDGSAPGWEPSASPVTLTATSPQGCDTQIVTKTAKSAVFRTVVYRFNLKLYWCWDYPKITKLGITCYASDVDSFTWRYSGCTATGYYYTWRGHPKGGRYQMAQATFSNCVFKYGCWKENVDTLEIWVNGNGAWTKKTS